MNPMHKAYPKITIILAAFVFLSAAFSIYAQDFGDFIYANTSVVFNYTPQYPGPFEDVNILLKGNGFDIDVANVTWIKDGKVVQKGKGKIQYSVRTGNIGSKIRIVARASDPIGNIREAVLNIEPRQIGFVWEAKTTAPAWYRGKPLPTSGSEVVVHTFAQIQKNGVVIPADNLIYKWLVNGKRRQNASGYGRRSLQFTMPKNSAAETVILLRVSDDTDTVLHEERFFVLSSHTAVNAYAVHPLYGIMPQKTLSKSSMRAGEEALIKMVPFFFSKADEDDIEYIWQINGSTVANTDNSSLLTFRTTPENSGRQSIYTIVKNPNNIFQAGRVQITILIK